MASSPLITPADLGLPTKFSTWRPKQWEAIEHGAASERQFVVHAAPTGTGKSVIGVAHAILTGGRSVYVTSTKNLQDQCSSDFSPCGMVDLRGRQNYHCVRGGTCADGRLMGCRDEGCEYILAREDFLQSKLTITNYSCYLSNVIHGEGMGDIDCLILDECFVAGTRVDGRRIESINVGDYVTAFNDETGKMGKRRVSRIFINRAPDTLVKLNFSDGRTIVCTEGHPFLTPHGWIPASLLQGRLCVSYGTREGEGHPGDLHGLSDEFSDFEERPTQVREVWYTANMWSEVRGEIGDTRDEIVRGITVQRTNETEKPNAVRGNQTENGVLIAPDWTQASDTRRERNGANDTPETSCGTIEPANGICSEYGSQGRSPEPLQIRHSRPAQNDLHRGGWQQPPIEVQTGTGQEERIATHWIRVESVEVFQSGDTQRFRKVCPDGLVYNLEVEGVHTYSANGIVVHNCHEALEELSSALEIRINHAHNANLYQALNITPPYRSDIARWRYWATQSIPKIRAQIQTVKANGDGDVKYLKALDGLMKNVTQLGTVDEKTWVVDESSRPGEVLFSPIWPTNYAQSILFRGIKHVLLISATIVPKTLELLGITENDYTYISHTNVFDHRRCPVYLWGATRIDNKSTEGDYAQLVGRMDSLIGRRLDRKGIIHPTSYDRQLMIAGLSDYAEIMLTPKGQGLTNAMKQFKEADPPMILNSPAVTTGYDFPRSQCEYQFLVKVPFIDTRSPIMAARCKADPEYSQYLTAQTLVQTCGRAMRGAEDQVENFLMDKHANWFFRKPEYDRNGKNTGGYRHLFPPWFINQLVWPQAPPQPPQRLED